MKVGAIYSFGLFAPKGHTQARVGFPVRAPFANTMMRGMRLFLRGAPQPERPLGRWRYEKSDAKRDRKIDLANTDHCGPCGRYEDPKAAPEVAADGSRAHPR